jgi:glutathione S-transferase
VSVGVKAPWSLLLVRLRAPRFLYKARPMLTVHHLNNSRSQRVLWLLEELELPYEIVHYQRDPQTMLAPASLRKAIHPLGKSPVVTTDDGLTLAESGAIIETVIERYGHGRLAPAAGTPEALRYRYWLHLPKARRCRRCCSS